MGVQLDILAFVNFETLERQQLLDAVQLELFPGHKEEATLSATGHTDSLELGDRKADQIMKMGKLVIIGRRKKADRQGGLRRCPHCKHLHTILGTIDEDMVCRATETRAPAGEWIRVQVGCGSVVKQGEWI